MDESIRTRVSLLCCMIVVLLFSSVLVACHQNITEQEQTPPNDSAGSDASNIDKYADRLLELELIGYANAVARFIELDVADVEKKIASGDSFFLFIGRPTCEWCRKIAPSLQEAASDVGVAMFLLDSTNTETDASLSDFRDRYGVATVPAIIRFRNDGSYVKLDISLNSDTPREDLTRLLNEETA